MIKNVMKISSGLSGGLRERDRERKILTRREAGKTQSISSPTTERCPACSLPDNSPQFLYWAWHSLVCNMPLASLAHLSWLCPLSVSHTPAHGQEHGKLASPWFWGSNTQQKLKHQWVIIVILILNSKHSTVTATRKKITPSSQPKPGYPCFITCHFWEEPVSVIFAT